MNMVTTIKAALSKCVPPLATLVASTIALSLISYGPVLAQNSGGDPPTQNENGKTRYPVTVEQVSILTAEYTAGPPSWGHRYIYDLKVIDNLGGAWGTGYPKEYFSNVSKNPALAQLFGAAPGSESSWDGAFNTPGPGEFQDQNSDGLSRDTGKNTFWYSFDQTFKQLDCSGAPWNLGTFHVQHYQSYVNRG